MAGHWVIRYAPGVYQGYPREQHAARTRRHPKVTDLTQARVFGSRQAASLARANAGGTVLTVEVVTREESPASNG